MDQKINGSRIRKAECQKGKFFGQPSATRPGLSPNLTFFKLLLSHKFSSQLPPLGLYCNWRPSWITLAIQDKTREEQTSTIPEFPLFYPPFFPMTLSMLSEGGPWLSLHQHEHCQKELQHVSCLVSGGCSQSCRAKTLATDKSGPPVSG